VIFKLFDQVQGRKTQRRSTWRGARYRPEQPVCNVTASHEDTKAGQRVEVREACVADLVAVPQAQLCKAG
jgi:hypothetical protein